MAMKMRNAFIALAVMLFTLDSVVAKKRDFDSSIFDKSSDFMKGFETGILVRSKKGDPEKFGCKIFHPEETSYLNNIVDKARKSLMGLKQMLPSLNHDLLEEIIDIVIETLMGISKL